MALLLYNVLLAIAFVLALPVFLWRDRGSRKYSASFRERMGRLPATLHDPRPTLWVHAVSVGEVLAARPLVAALKQRFPRHRIALSTTTVTGQALARKSASFADAVLFAPFDFPGPVRAALDALRPELLVLVETELWPNLIHEAHRRGTRIALVNGRISPRSFPRYLRVSALLSPVLAEVDLFLMQGEPHAERIRRMGAPAERVRVPGNLKFDAPLPQAPPRLQALLAPWAGRPLWVAGSTVAGEEEVVLAAFRRARERHPELALVLAPRHPERFALVPPLVEAAGLRCARRSELANGAPADAPVLVLDSIGELAPLYRDATVAFVGGSLVPAGGHNVLEAAAFGKPVLVGPHMENFQEIADDFIAQDALVQVRDADELERALESLLGDEERRNGLGRRASQLVAQNRGALERTVDALAGLVA